MKENGRLFVPLSKDAFYDFRDRGKAVEIRKYGRNFTEKTVFPGRAVELRLGYSGNESIWGVIGQVVIGSMELIFEEFELHRVEPRFTSVDEAIKDNIDLLGSAEKEIAFEIRNKKVRYNKL